MSFAFGCTNSNHSAGCFSVCFLYHQPLAQVPQNVLGTHFCGCSADPSVVGVRAQETPRAFAPEGGISFLASDAQQTFSRRSMALGSGQGINKHLGTIF